MCCGKTLIYIVINNIFAIFSFGKTPMSKTVYYPIYFQCFSTNNIYYLLSGHTDTTIFFLFIYTYKSTTDKVKACH